MFFKKKICKKEPLSLALVKDIHGVLTEDLNPLYEFLRLETEKTWKRRLN